MCRLHVSGDRAIFGRRRALAFRAITLEAFGRLRHQSPLAAAMWAAVPCCEWVVVREVLLQLPESRFADVPASSMQTIRSIFGGFGTSLPLARSSLIAFVPESICRADR